MIEREREREIGGGWLIVVGWLVGWLVVWKVCVLGE